MEDRRTSIRQVVHRKARVLFDEGKPPLDCIILDLTHNGACLQLALNIYIPKWFELSLDNFKSKRPCHLIWQRDDRLGVCFS